MARSLELVSKDLEALQAATEKLDQELQDLYSQYFTALGGAVRQQLVLAAYHLCTQVYPDAFLALSVNQRAQLQEALRKLGRQGRSQIHALTTQQPFGLMSLALLMGQANFKAPEAEATALPTDGQTDADPEEAEALAEPTAIAPMPSPTDALNAVAAEPPEPISPLLLAKRHVLMERQIRAILHTVSNLANYTLKQAHILPDLPEAVLTAAAEAEMGDSVAAMPNLLNVLVEMGRRREEGEAAAEEDEDNDEEAGFEEEDDDDSEHPMTHLVAVSLRLADIEFADPQTALWRNRIQETLSRLRKLGSRHQKLQREKARAEAEAAWRSTWFEDSGESVERKGRAL